MSKSVRIVGVPMDLGAEHRGTDMGPSALRVVNVAEGLRKLGFEVGREQDVGVPAMETRSASRDDARFHSEILHVCTRLCGRVKAILDQGDFPLVYGGDHSIAMGTFAGVAAHYQEKNENVGLIWFDAHGDMNTPETSPSGNIHGMPLAVLLGQGDEALCEIGGFSPKVRPQNVALIGIRDIDQGEREAIHASGVKAFTMRDIDEKGMAQVIQEALVHVNDGTAGFHLSFDVDGLDPGIAPGTGTAVHGGVAYREAHLFMEHIADDGRMVSAEVVEVNPALDERNRTAELVKELLLSAFGKRIL